MIKTVISKIRNNIWMFVCLIVGSLLITGVLASIPMYSFGTLRQMLATDLKKYEKENNIPAGQMFFDGKIPSSTFGSGRWTKAEEIESQVIDGIDGKAVTIKNSYTQILTINMAPERISNTFSYSTSWNLSTLSGLKDNVELVQGSWCSETYSGDAIEVVVEENEWAQNSNVKLGEVYTFTVEGVTIYVKPVGVFKVIDETSEFWYNNELLFSDALFCEYDAYKALVTQDGYEKTISQVKVYANLDFSNAGIDNLTVFSRYYKALSKYSKSLGSGRSSLSLNCVSLINSYIKKTTKMQMSLWVLNVPVIAMLAFYMIMVTKMIIEEDRNEISTFKSRGAKTSQIFLRYVVECGIISVFALVFGPLLGLFLAKTVGNASGFMEFNSTDVLKIKLTGSAYLYAVIACVFFSALILLPALAATRKTIVNLKQRKARKSRLSWWEKWCVDIMCLVVSIGLFIVYKRLGGFSGDTDSTVDPVVYVISTLFILGCGLLFLRIYPVIVAFFFSIFKRAMRPAPYSAFVQVARGGNDFRFLMLFLIMTISVGIYSSASARIINNNVENTVNYEYGADVVLSPDFTGYDTHYSDNGTIIPENFRHFPYESYTEKADFVTAASRVAHYENNYVLTSAGSYFRSPVEIMAFDPYEFGQISWCGTSLNGVNWKEYLNVLEVSPTAVIISKDLAEKAEVEVGDTIKIDINGSNQHNREDWPTVQCYVAGIVEYWPTIELAETREITDDNGEVYEVKGSSYFILMNFEYIYSLRSTTDFEIYLALDDSVKTADKETFVEMALEAGIINDESEIVTYRPEIMESEKSDSMLKGLNGSYSIGFVSTLTVAFVGFLIYWIMNVRKRKLQFGILRAMGLTKGNLTTMLVYEHLLTTGVSVLMGILIGALTVKIYTPLLGVIQDSETLPLEIIFSRSDNMKIYIVVAAMLLTGIIILAGFINKLKINEAVKIGEE